MRKFRASLAAALLVVSLAACTNWERNTYNTLATSKAVIDGAAQAYNAGTIPQTKTNHDIIAKAQQAQNVAVDAFKVYLYAKAGGQGDLATLQANVTNAVTQLTLDILNVKAIAAAKPLTIYEMPADWVPEGVVVSVNNSNTKDGGPNAGR